MLDGIVGGCDPRGKTQLAVDGADMGVDGARADDQALGHLGIGEPLGQQAQHLHFACGQVVWRGRRRWVENACLLERLWSSVLHRRHLFGCDQHLLSVISRPWRHAAANGSSLSRARTVATL